MEMKRPRWLLLLAALTLGLALVAAGCGGDDDADNGDATPAEEVPEDEQAAEQVVTIAWGAEPPSLDPGLATDTTSANILHNIMEGLVTLEGEDLEPTPAVAESWDVSDDGTVYTFNIREDATWTNGDPVTANDFEWAWKRVLDPETAADYAYQLYGIQGAQDYNECEENCEQLRDGVGVTATDERTLEVTLTSAQPWFAQLVAHTSFLPVHEPTVEQHGANWTEAANIVTNGPFMLERWEHEANIDLVKNPDWRNADEVTLERANGRIIVDGTTAVQAFEAGEVDIVTTGIPPAEMGRLQETDDFQQYPTLGTYYYGFNVNNVTDVNQRRAMSLAIDRRSIIDNIAQGGQIPASVFTPEGIAGYDDIAPDSPWTPAEGDLERAQEVMEEAENPKMQINLVHNNAPGHREIAVAVQGMWRELGLNVNISAQEWAQYLENIGPPPSQQVDVFRLGWIYDYPDAMNGLELWMSGSGNNPTGWANEEFDRLIEEARGTAEDDERFGVYNQAEELMFGEDGEVPLIPIYHYTQVTLERDTVRDTTNFDAQTRLTLKSIVVRDGS
jgi:oligopeptide transport system substrate-binding protein